jgi:hypothetical protein
MKHVVFGIVLAATLLGCGKAATTVADAAAEVVLDAAVDLADAVTGSDLPDAVSAADAVTAADASTPTD